MKRLIGFARFWYDFLVGDSATLAVGGVAALFVGWLALTVGGLALAQVLLPLTVVVTLAVSLRRAP